MIEIKIYEDESRTILVGTMRFPKNSMFFRFFKGYFSYNDINKITRSKKRYEIKRY